MALHRKPKKELHPIFLPIIAILSTIALIVGLGILVDPLIPDNMHPPVSESPTAPPTDGPLPANTASNPTQSTEAPAQPDTGTVPPLTDPLPAPPPVPDPVPFNPLPQPLPQEIPATIFSIPAVPSEPLPMPLPLPIPVPDAVIPLPLPLPQVQTVPAPQPPTVPEPPPVTVPLPHTVCDITLIVC